MFEKFFKKTDATVYQSPESIANAAIALIKKRSDKIAALSFVLPNRIEFELNDGAQTGGRFDTIPDLVGKSASEQQNGIEEIANSVVEHAEAVSQHFQKTASKPRLMPIIRTQADVENYNKDRNTDMIGCGLARPIAGDLFVLLVEDSNDMVTVLLESDPKKYPEGIDAMHRLAVENLAEFAGATDLGTFTSLSPFNRLILDGYYDTSLILLPNMWTLAADNFFDGNTPLCVCAGRDALWFFYEDSEPDELAEQLQAFARGVQKHVEHPLSMTILTRNEDGMFTAVEPFS